MVLLKGNFFSPPFWVLQTGLIIKLILDRLAGENQIFNYMGEDFADGSVGCS